jgi:hypothetical protein
VHAPSRQDQVDFFQNHLWNSCSDVHCHLLFPRAVQRRRLRSLRRSVSHTSTLLAFPSRARPALSKMATLTNGNGAASDAQAQAQLNGLIQADASKSRVPVHTFDPNASSQEKGAAAGKGREVLQSAASQKRKGDAEGAFAFIVVKGQGHLPVGCRASDIGCIDCSSHYPHLRCRARHPRGETVRSART